LPIKSEWNPRQQIAALECENALLRAELEKNRKWIYLGSMATTVAHEFSQPIHIIRAATSAGLDDIKDNLFEQNEIKPLLERISRQTGRLQKLLQNFRQFARDKNDPETVNLNQLLEQTIETHFEAEFKNDNIKLVRQLEPGQIISATNPFQLQAVLNILLTNAKKALEGRKNAKVWVKTFRSQSNQVGFSVEDNGAGLAPEYRQHLFEPFVSTTGMGLGLYLAQSLIKELKGQLRYEDRVGGGAGFIVTLPTG